MRNVLTFDSTKMQLSVWLRLDPLKGETKAGIAVDVQFPIHIQS